MGVPYEVTEFEVEIPTPSGSCNSFLASATPGKFPGVFIWADAFGLRPSMREMAVKLAAEGYAVLVPNPFYRVTRELGLDPMTFDWGSPADREKLRPAMQSATAPGNAESDALAFVDFLDTQESVDPSLKVGMSGYCMGGPIAIRSAAVLGARAGACACLHAGGLVTDKPDSPHLLAPKISARIYIGIAGPDDAKDPSAKDKLRDSFDAAKVPTEIEVYPHAAHGWCMTDFPIYKEDAADRAWSKILELFSLGLGVLG